MQAKWIPEEHEVKDVESVLVWFKSWQLQDIALRDCSILPSFSTFKHTNPLEGRKWAYFQIKTPGKFFGYPLTHLYLEFNQMLWKLYIEVLQLDYSFQIDIYIFLSHKERHNIL